MHILCEAVKHLEFCISGLWFSPLSSRKLFNCSLKVQFTFDSSVLTACKLYVNKMAKNYIQLSVWLKKNHADHYTNGVLMSELRLFRVQLSTFYSCVDHIRI